MGQKVDYLIRGGRVIDCYRGLDQVCDIAVKNGEIVSGADVDAAQVVDASGCLVTPGLIDFHCHIGSLATDLGIPSEAVCFPSGVTTAVDAGSFGASNYEAFRCLSANQKLRTKAFLYVGSGGQVTTAYPDNIDPDCFQTEKILRLLKKYPDHLLGLKIRQGAENAGGRGLEPTKRMLEIAGQVQCPVAVHTTNAPRPVEEIARMLRSGDIFVHLYQGKGDTYIRSRSVIQEMKEHQKRGVILDAANGGNHFCFSVARACMEEGLLPDVISTDLTTKTCFVPGKVFSLPFVLSKYLAMGLDIQTIIRCVTTTPARLLHAERELGSLCEGTCADITIMRMVERAVVFEDFKGEKVEGNRLFRVEMTLREGVPLFRQIDFF